MMTLALRYATHILIAIAIGLAGYAATQHLSATHYRNLYEDLARDTARLANDAAIAAKAKEDKDAETIKTAMAGRAAALERLRVASRSSHLPDSTATAGRTGAICFDAAGYNAALEQGTGLAGEGETAVINSRALLAAWPR